MAASTVFHCICGVQKKTSNHWVMARITRSGLLFMPWDWNLALHDDIIILCGERCSVALLSRHLGDWKEAAMDKAALAAGFPATAAQSPLPPAPPELYRSPAPPAG